MNHLHHTGTAGTPGLGVGLGLVALLVLSACSSSGTNTESATPSAATTSPGVTSAITGQGSDGSPVTSATPPDPTGSTLDPTQCAMPRPIDEVVEVRSSVFETTDRVSVHFTPCSVDQPTPNAIVYLLHGASADETQWPDVDIFTAADAAVMNGTMPPSILVAPDAAPAYACRSCADDLLTHLVDEIEPVIARTAPVDPARRAIGGISRGGGLALDVAGLAPADFVAVGAHSSVEASDSALAAIAAARLPVRFDVGDDDGLAGASHHMTESITTNGGRSELVVGIGGHDRAYWRSEADAYIAFYASHLMEA